MAWKDDCRPNLRDDVDVVSNPTYDEGAPPPGAEKSGPETQGPKTLITPVAAEATG